MINLAPAFHIKRWLLLVCCSISPLTAAEPTILDLWPGKPPGETKALPPEENTTKPEDKLVGDRPIIKLANVSVPTLSIYRPAKGRDSGAAVIVCPGGGHRILAFDHEGTEVAAWLNTLGVTGVVLKYRVPFRNPDKRWEAAVQDAQRAVSLVRSKAGDWNIDSKRIGILGFSAGGETAGLTAMLHNQRQYSPADEVDQVSCRPDFAALVYPGGLTEQDNPWQLREHVRVDSTTPPMFFAHSYDDRVPVSNSLLVFAELKKAGVPAELHLYASGGHGYGMRETGHACNTWPQRCADWMRGQGWLAGETKQASASRLPE
jgi:acetyl esterase/lipase